jgi:D-inositol-3-phosphate glycosyltransferase
MNVYLVGLADALAERGLQPELLTRASAAGAPAGETPGGVPVRSLLAGSPEAVPKARLVTLTTDFGRAMTALPRFDLVHSHYWLSGVAALPVARGWGAPHLQSLHTVGAAKNESLAADDSPEPAERIDGERMLVNRSALTVAASQAERRAILQHYSPPVSRVVVVAPGVDRAIFHPAHRTPSAASPAASPRPFVLVLARIQPLKGPDLAIAALAEIPASRRPLLVIAGGTSPGHDDYARALHRQVDDLGLSGDVVFLPAQSRVQAAALVAQAALLLVPSHSETYGLVALEAASSGTPVVASRAGGLSESVVDGVSGVLVDERSADAWARAIDGLLGDPRRLAALSAGALEHAEAHSWSLAAARMAEHYEHALAFPHPHAEEQPRP